MGAGVVGQGEGHVQRIARQRVLVASAKASPGSCQPCSTCKHLQAPVGIMNIGCLLTHPIALMHAPDGAL